MTRNPGRTPGTGIRLFVLAIELPPAAYVAITGTAPGWVRIWFVTWLGLWLLTTVVVAVRAQSQQVASQQTAPPRNVRSYR